jgi:hypothetical protein
VQGMAVIPASATAATILPLLYAYWRADLPAPHVLDAAAVRLMQVSHTLTPPQVQAIASTYSSLGHAAPLLFEQLAERAARDSGSYAPPMAVSLMQSFHRAGLLSERLAAAFPHARRAVPCRTAEAPSTSHLSGRSEHASRAPGTHSASSTPSQPGQQSGHGGGVDTDGGSLNDRRSDSGARAPASDTSSSGRRPHSPAEADGSDSLHSGQRAREARAVAHIKQRLRGDSKPERRPETGVASGKGSRPARASAVGQRRSHQPRRPVFQVSDGVRYNAWVSEKPAVKEDAQEEGFWVVGEKAREG